MYRLLDVGEVLSFGDEYFEVSKLRWLPIGDSWVGGRIMEEMAIAPTRRKIDDTAESPNTDVKHAQAEISAILRTYRQSNSSWEFYDWFGNQVERLQKLSAVR